MTSNAIPEILKNPLRGEGIKEQTGLAKGEIETDGSAARALYEQCPVASVTPLIDHTELAALTGIAKLHLKDERERMGLGAFKAVGAAYAIAKQAAEKADPNDAEAMGQALKGTTFVCASAGNHGISLAAGAKVFGANAVVYLAETVPTDFADRLRAKGARVIIEGDNYEASLEASIKAAKDNDWYLLADGTWEGYVEPARDVMEGYLIMGNEVADQLDEPPTHVFLQCGVGGLASGCAAAARVRWGDDVTLIVVEPDAAPALIESVKAGKVVETTGPVSTMGRLDCKTPSHLALKYLAREADYFITITDNAVDESLKICAQHGVTTSPSGGAGLAALHQIDPTKIGLTKNSRVVCYISEGE